MQVQFLDLKAPHAAHKVEIMAVWEEILLSAGFIGGPHVLGFEEDFASACGVSHAAAVNSGTDALRFIFIALGLRPGDEVITVPNTFIATTEAISQAGGRPVFVDIEPGTCNIDPARIEAAITPKTRGIVPVHLYGQCADMDPVLDIAKKRGLWVVEDACQAHLAEYKGRKAGTIGAAAAFSFYPGKNLGACGEAGAVTTNDAALAATVRMLRDHGQSKKYYHSVEGYNGRCDALQAAALRIKLRGLARANEARRAHARLYRELLAGAPGIEMAEERPHNLHAYHLFVVFLRERDRTAAALLNDGISTGIHYPVPLHMQEAYRWMGLGRGSFPVTEERAASLLSLPMYPELTEAQIRHVCDSLKRNA